MPDDLNVEIRARAAWESLRNSHLEADIQPSGLYFHNSWENSLAAVRQFMRDAIKASDEALERHEDAVDVAVASSALASLPKNPHVIVAGHCRACGTRQEEIVDGLVSPECSGARSR